jgi:1-acyl-sn-glycerol-3-phosphate acyltransferase
VTARRTESLAVRWCRRAVVVPAYLAALAITIACLPVVLPLVLAIDLVRDRRLPRTRLALFAVAYLVCEVLGLVAAAALWPVTLLSRERTLRWHYGLQSLWARALFAAARALFGLRLEVTGADATARGPFLLFARHASLADTVLPAVLVAHPHGIRLRWVLKRELLWDPCLDFVGQRLPNVFVRRGSDDSAREIAAVLAVASDLGVRDGVFIYPEGTRATRAKRARARERLARSDPARAARLAGLRHLLPPRRGGPLALLDAHADVDVVFMAHAGLDGAATLRDAWAGALIGRAVRVAFRRVPASRIPRDPAQRLRWLDEQWLRMDEWVDEPSGGPTALGLVESGGRGGAA